ncbi:MAG TPA: type II toxin-antitoxin system prevent-host-death family antitoxin [Sphingomonas sp.]|nr:type II toxin-antitoxin system prevent-host-death family antitoxin [Sphingomonas sp.]
METVNIHEAKTRLSQLIAKAVAGEPFIIAKAGKPLVKVEKIEDEPKKPRRFGFLKGMIHVPDDFDTMFQKEIEEMFYGDGEPNEAAA